MQLLVQRTKNKLCGNVHNFHTKVSLVANNRREGNWTELKQFHISGWSLFCHSLQIWSHYVGFAKVLHSNYLLCTLSSSAVHKLYERTQRERETAFYLVRQCHHPPTIIVTMIIIISCLFTTHRSRTRIKVTRKVLSFRIVWPLRKLYHRVRKWLELQRFFFVYHKYHQILN